MICRGDRPVAPTETLFSNQKPIPLSKLKPPPLFFLPTANKLKDIIKKQTHAMEMIIEGIIAIAEGENPRNLETKLKGFMG